MKLGVLKNSEFALGLLVQKELPIRLAFQLNSILDDVEEHLTRLEEFRVKLVEKYGEENEKGEMVVKKSKLGSFHKEYDELLDTDIDLKPTPIPLSVLEELNIKMSIKNVDALFKAGFITE
jgi:hypothetical protein